VLLPLQFLLDKNGMELVLQLKELNYLPLVRTGEYVFFDDKIHKISISIIRIH